MRVEDPYGEGEGDGDDEKGCVARRPTQHKQQSQQQQQPFVMPYARTLHAHTHAVLQRIDRACVNTLPLQLHSPVRVPTRVLHITTMLLLLVTQ